MPQTTKMCYTIAMKLYGKSIGQRKGAQDKASGPATRTILVAGMGTSPAVLTEAVCKHRGNLIYFAVETRHEPTHFHQ